MAGEVTLNCQLNKDYFPVTGQSQLAYILIEAKPVVGEFLGQMPLNFGLVLDRSGSMSGSKIRNVRSAVAGIIDQMSPSDHISVTIFDDYADVLIPGQPVSDKENLKSEVEKISDRGGTTMSKGMKKGLEEIRKNQSKEKINKMLLLTDGQTWQDEDECQELAKQAGMEGISVIALGVGEDWNENLLDAIGNNSNGMSDYIQDAEAINKIFGGAMKSMQAVATQNTIMTLRLSAGVSPSTVHQVIPLIKNLGIKPLSDRDVIVEMGELDKELGQSLLVEMMLPPRQAGRFRIAQAEIAYDIPNMNIIQEKVRSDIILEFSHDPNLTNTLNPQVMNLVEKVSAFKLQTRALDEAAAGNILGATQKLRAAATRLLNMGEEDLANAALQEADNLEQKGEMSASGTKKLRYETRKLTQRLDD